LFEGIILSLTIKALNHNISDGGERRKILTDLSLSVKQGECIALMGDSGSGKTTLLNLIAGLEPIQHGQINVAELALETASEQQLSQHRKMHIGIIFQQFNLLSSLSVKDNIEFSAKLANRFDPALVMSLAQELGISSLLNKHPATLSGGEMQRVAIARALCARPQLLLADEPTGNLDENNSAHVVKQLTALAKSNNTALLMVTHSSDIAHHMDKTYRLHDGKLNLLEG
jgi:putative ABC transport system ATP-binding protein